MDRNSSGRPPVASFRPLTKEDIDRRIEHVLEDLASAGERIGSDADADPGRPRRIAARELVERVRPFLSSN